MIHYSNIPLEGYGEDPEDLFELSYGYIKGDPEVGISDNFTLSVWITNKYGGYKRDITKELREIDLLYIEDKISMASAGYLYDT